MISVSHLHSVLPMPSRDDVFPHAEPVFNRTFMKRWSDQMVHPWRFYYLDLDRINACSEKTQCSMLVAEEYIKVTTSRVFLPEQIIEKKKKTLARVFYSALLTPILQGI